MEVLALMINSKQRHLVVDGQLAGVEFEVLRLGLRNARAIKLPHVLSFDRFLPIVIILASIYLMNTLALLVDVYVDANLFFFVL